MSSKQREQWESLVGRFILICGDIELRLLQLHWNLNINGNYNPDLKNKGLGAKARKILKELEPITIDANLKKTVRRILNDVIKFTHTRNLVAHSPLSMDIFDDDEGAIIPPPVIRSLKNSEFHISFNELASKVDEGKSLNSKLFDILNDVGDAASK